jgi:opacity protein-like surface antigen
VNVSSSVALTVDFRHRQVSGKDFPWDANSGFEVGRLKTNTFSAGLRFRF